MWWPAFVTKYSLTVVIIQRLVLYDNITRLKNGLSLKHYHHYKVLGIVSGLVCPHFSSHLLCTQKMKEAEDTRTHTAEHANVLSALFGVLKQRLRCMHRDGGDITYSPQKACKIVVASMILHNMCINAGLPLEEEDLEQPVHNDYDDFPENCARNEVNANGWDVRQQLIVERFQ